MSANAKTVIEVLYPEYANQAGDNGNAMYLRACLPDAEFVETTHDDVPYFAEHVPSLILLCGMSEAQQVKTIELLRPYRDRLIELIDAGVPMLFTGSAPEVLGTKIVNPDGSETPALGLLDFVTHCNIPARYHDVVIGDLNAPERDEAIKVVGFKFQFTQREADASAGQQPFCRNEVGFGLNKQSSEEGFRKNNLMATWLIGPLLPLNPDFTRYLLDLIGEKDARVVRGAFEDVPPAGHGTCLLGSVFAACTVAVDGGTAKAIKRIRAAGPMVPPPVFAFGMPVVIMVCFERIPASAFVALAEKSKYVRLKAVDFACIKLQRAYEGSMRYMNTVQI